MIVGLTGGIASGKSAVARLFAEHGVPVIDLDQVARDVVAPGTPLLAQVIDYVRKLHGQTAAKVITLRL